MKTETERLENTFDLVMLSDYYYESLVLLGQELCVQPQVLYVEEWVNFPLSVRIISRATCNFTDNITDSKIINYTKASDGIKELRKSATQQHTNENIPGQIQKHFSYQSCPRLKHFNATPSKCNFWREDSFWITKENISHKTITSMSTSKKFLIKKLKHLEGEKWNGRFKNSNICTRNVTKIQKNAHSKGTEY